MNGDRVPCHLAEGLNMELKMAVQGLSLKAFNSRNAEWIARKIDVKNALEIDRWMMIKEK